MFLLLACPSQTYLATYLGCPDPGLGTTALKNSHTGAHTPKMLAIHFHVTHH